MEKFELEPALADEIRSKVLGDGFMKLVQSVRRNGETFRISMRPVAIGGDRRFQAEMNDGGHVQVKNLDAAAAADGLDEIIAQKGARELHLITASGDLHVRVTKKGRALVSRSKPMERVAEVLPHDREKKTPLSSFDSAALLRATSLADGSGAVRASMRGKYDQVNEFLKHVSEMLAAAAPSADAPFTVVDCGCGKAYLTAALYCYLVESMGFKDVKVIGVDRRADVVAAARKIAEQLDAADRLTFVESDLSDFKLDHADMVVSLHACDTATDEAIARAVEWKARYVAAAPCCQHELQKVVGRAGCPAPKAFEGMMRQGILRERLCDLLTDSFRAMILRILGFRTQVVEFVSQEATARNVLIKGEYSVKPGQPGPVSEYLELRDFWRVTPWLETRLKDRLDRHFSRFGEGPSGPPSCEKRGDMR